MKKILFILVFISFFSCNKKEIRYHYPTGELSSIVQVKGGKNEGSLKKFYKTGEIAGIGHYKEGKKNGVFKEFYKNGVVKSIETYKSGRIIDTSFVFNSLGKKTVAKYINNNSLNQISYFENGVVKSFGKIQDSLKIGWWSYHNPSGVLIGKTEYLIFNNSEYVNQTILFNNDKSIDYENSNFFKINFPDSIYANKLTKGYLKLNPYLSREKDFHMIYYNIIDDNGDIIKRDSTFGKNDMDALLLIKIKDTGRYLIDGYFLEEKLTSQINQLDTSKVNIISTQKKLYFNKSIYVNN